ncbi:UreD urease accessory protein-domain-containing protein [Piptocephalis cylindrospora]|uniref:UreD urease accessory protein-domain-containing protein n=1 Tax=Piptocephalis cylindrospora TaxID=1907219 RepID=A0A4P9XYU5_9FUNG|nr:UreD urease accessory protein-domain-containing protein [Piptocephalis cylindrospora]|eukprot:RKP11628.1 UreD urease accessory protein-domain-containing protein [Piptocephalis cylindrospora]
MSTPVDDLAPGSGRIHITLPIQEASGSATARGSVQYPHFSCTYPLKLMSTQALQPGVGCVYNMGYGGGMVDGDKVEMNARVDGGATFCLLTQGSTKVFKRRRPMTALQDGTTSSTDELRPTGATSILNAHVGASSTLVLLPCPVSPFRDAIFRQIQHIHLEDSSSSSLVLLDWFTAGRPGHGDRWAFSSYLSDISVHVQGRLLLRDLMEVVPNRVPYLGPYNCYATLIVWGHQVEPTIAYFRGAGAQREMHPCRSPPPLIWSVCDTRDGAGIVVRCSALTTEGVTDWLREVLDVLSDVCGEDILERAMGD